MFYKKNPSFNRVALMGREGTKQVPETLNALADYLISKKKEVVVEASAAEMLLSHNLPIVPAFEIRQHADLLIVVGGDGSMLNAAHLAAPQGVPVLGINRGRLGFLTDIHPDQLTAIDAILEGHYQEESRFLLSAMISKDDGSLTHQLALNDIVLLPGDVAKMIEFEIYINDEFVCYQRADGLIVTTPTGSTAYALSGGGPIMHPSLDAIALVPMFPHTLSSRPIVVQGNSKVRVLITKENDVSPSVSSDGQTTLAVSPGGTVEIQKNKQTLRLIHPNDYNYYDTLRRKLDWEKRTTNV